MKILVAYKRVVDYNVRVQVKPDGSGVVTDGVKLSANPFDEIALEEALRLRDKGIATEVVVVTIAPVSYTHLDVYKRQDDALALSHVIRSL